MVKIGLVMVLSYLIGSITSGDIVAFFKKVNLRGEGSGNIGATNVFRTMGSFYGAVVLIADALKGVIAVLLGRMLGPQYGIDLGVFAGILAIIGHNWPIYTRFEGGKGIATSLGVVIALTPWSLTMAIPVFFLAFVITGYVSLGSILATVTYPISVIIFYPGDYPKIVFAIFVGVLAVYRHRKNIQRLMKGQENRILYQKKKERQEK